MSQHPAPAPAPAAPRRRWLVLALWAGVLALCLAVLASSRYSTDMSAFLPRQADERQQLLIDQIRDGALSRMVLIGIDGGSATQRADASRALAKALRRSDLFAGVVNGDEDSRERDQALLLQRRYLLSPAVTPEHFSVDGLRGAIGQSITELSGSAGMMLRALLPRDPTGELLRTLDGLAGSQPMVGDAEGVWSAADGQRALLIAMTRAAGTDTDAQERALAQIHAAFEAAQAGADLRLRLSGAPVFSVDARSTIRSEVQRLSLIVSVAVSLLLLSVYRSWRNVLIGLLPVASGVVVAIAAVALGFEVVHAVTIGFGTTLMGEAIDYSVYYLLQSGDPQAWRQRYWPTIRLGVITSVCGFGVLLFSSFPGLAQLGAYSVAGLLAAATTTRFVLPLLPTAPIPSERIERLGELVARMVGAARRLRWPAAALALGALLLVMTDRDALWAEGLAGLNPAPLHLQRLDAELRQDTGVPDLQHLVVVTAPTQDAALQAAEQIGQRLTPLVAAGTVVGFDSPARVLPSTNTQLARRAALPAPDELQARLQQALAGLPLQAERLAPFVQDVATAREQPLLTAEELNGTSFGFMLSTLLLPRADGWSVLLPIHLPEGAAGEQVGAFRAALEPLLAAPVAGAQAFYLDLQAQTTSVFGRYLDEALGLAALGGGVIVLLLGLALRQPGRLLRVLLPLASAVLIVMAAHLLLGVRMTLLHLVGLLLIVAVGSNYALFFNQRVDEVKPGAGMPRHTALASLALANLSTLIGFGALGFSQVPVLRAIGTTVGPGALLALLLAMAWSGQQGSARDAAAARAHGN